MTTKQLPIFNKYLYTIPIQIEINTNHTKAIPNIYNKKIIQ